MVLRRAEEAAVGLAPGFRRQGQLHRRGASIPGAEPRPVAGSGMGAPKRRAFSAVSGPPPASRVRRTTPAATGMKDSAIRPMGMSQSAWLEVAIHSEREVQAENQGASRDAVRQLAVAVVVDRQSDVQLGSVFRAETEQHRGLAAHQVVAF